MSSRRFCSWVAGALLAFPGEGCLIPTATGTGGATSTTTVSIAVGTTSGSAGSSMATSGSAICTPHAGTGKTDAICDSLANLPAQCTASGAPPPAFVLCHAAYKVLYPGQFEELANCFGTIASTAEDTCGSRAHKNVLACLADVYADNCTPNPYAATKCNQEAQACAASNDPNFATAMCDSDLAPFTEAGVDAFFTCAGSSMGKCADIETECLAELL